MGYLEKDVGRVGLETRRESFVIHLLTDMACGPQDGLESWDRDSHPEFHYYDLPDLIEALIAIRDRAEPQRVAWPSPSEWLNSMGKATFYYESFTDEEPCSFTNGSVTWQITREQAEAWKRDHS